jgi:hypothetical protein
MSNEKVDIAIVGGGVSGVYSAWRLKLANPKSKIVVFEASGRIGGRLLSIRPPDISNMVAELGGMRILPEVQPLIGRLLQVMNEKLPPEQRIETYPFPVDEPQNIAYVRGVHLRLSDFTLHPSEVPYNLTFLEKGGTASSIIINAIEQIVPGITTSTLTEEQRRRLAQNAIFAGTPLYRQGFWNVLARVISGEAYQLCQAAGGYDSTLSNWNAADAIPWYLSDFGAKAQYQGFKKGFELVPRTLAKLFAEANGELSLGNPLLGFNWTSDGVELRLKQGRVQAKSLILAMPRRSLDLFTTYGSPWWLAAGLTDSSGKSLPVEAGRTVTDLPVRQTYYWPRDDGKPATQGPAMLMASYDDGTNIGFWDGLRPRRHWAWTSGREVPQVTDPFVGDRSASETEWSQYQAPQAMVAEVARQLGVVHGLSYTPAVKNAAFRDWGDDPYGGGWNSWNIGIKSQDVKKRMIQPLDGRPLYVCGEAYSDAQGWVEGALQTADMLLAKFGVGPL